MLSSCPVLGTMFEPFMCLDLVFERLQSFLFQIFDHYNTNSNAALPASATCPVGTNGGDDPNDNSRNGCKTTMTTRHTT